MLSAAPSLTSKRRRSKVRPAFTLAEVVLALVLGAIVLTLVAKVGRGLQHQLADEGDRLATGEQLAAAAELLPIDLRALAPPGGDISLGEARDSSLQLRAPLGSALVCGGSADQLIIAPYLGPNGRSITPAVQDGDTAWLLIDSDSGESWRPAPLRALRRTNGTCPTLIDAVGARVFDVSHLWTADLRDSVAAPTGIVRITRPARYSFYRSSDGHWYLGLRTWNSAISQFNAIQPISGPYAAPARGTGFRYYDSSGASISTGTTDTRGIARIEALLLGEQWTAARVSPPEESLRVVVALRNRR